MLHRLEYVVVSLSFVILLIMQAISGYVRLI